MKTKLLKKIRKQYSIVYYPNGHYIKHIDSILQYNIYRVSGGYMNFSYKQSKNECLDWIFKDVKDKYYRKIKSKGNCIKIWYKY